MINTKRVRRALRLNAGFSFISGSLLCLMTQTTAEFIGIGPVWFYGLTGVGLLLFATYLVWFSGREQIDPLSVLQISLADFLWVAGTIVVFAVFWQQLSLAAIVVLTVIAGAVLYFALSQLQGITEMFVEPRVADQVPSYRLCMDIAAPIDARKLWTVVSDLSSIAQYAPKLVRSELRASVDAETVVRECEDLSGNQWAEQLVDYDEEQRSFTVRFLCDEPGFPYPFSAAEGGWQVREQGSSSMVSIWFAASPKQPWTAPFILALMSSQASKDFSRIVANMVASTEPENSIENSPSRRLVARLVPCV